MNRLTALQLAVGFYKESDGSIDSLDYLDTAETFDKFLSKGGDLRSRVNALQLAIGSVFVEGEFSKGSTDEEVVTRAGKFYEFLTYTGEALEV